MPARRLDYGTTGGKGLSYSRLQTLHACPKQFELENIHGLGVQDDENINFAFGHAVGAGVQQLLLTPDNLNLAYLECFAAWDIDIAVGNERKKKTLSHAIRAVKIFYDMVEIRGFLKGYELAHLKGKPAVELTFCITMHDGYVYEGHIDVVLYHPEKNTYLVLELKTTVFNNIHEAMYKNSDQALGYSLVLDSIAVEHGAQNSYYVMYLVYKSSAMEYEHFLFPKSRTQRAKFINNLLLDIEQLEYYAMAEHYPQHGESCFNFFSPCEFFDVCNLSDEAIQRISKAVPMDELRFSVIKKYDFVFDIEDIKNTQLEIIKETVLASDTNTVR